MGSDFNVENRPTTLPLLKNWHLLASLFNGRFNFQRSDCVIFQQISVEKWPGGSFLNGGLFSTLHRQWIVFIGVFVHLCKKNIWQIEFVVICIYSKGCENRFVILMQKICKIVWRVPRKRVKSKFLFQDAGIITPGDTMSCIVVRSFVCRKYYKVLIETGKISDNLRVTENGLVSGVDRAFKSSNSTSQNIGDLRNPLGKSVDFDFLFLGPTSGILLTRVHDDIEIMVPWIWDWFPVFRGYRKDLSVFDYRRYWDHQSLYW